VILADASHTLLSISRKDVRELLRFQLRATGEATDGIAEILGETAHLRWTEKRPSGLVVRF
jgi:hypothetical protein